MKRLRLSGPTLAMLALTAFPALAQTVIGAKSGVINWVEGDTLHYFTDGSTHNQVSLSLVDRELTRRLNEESGLQVKLPPAK